MFLLIKSAKWKVRGAGSHKIPFTAHRTLHFAQLMLVLAVVALSGCSEKRAVGPKTFFNIDSLVDFQIQHLKGGYSLNKLADINGQKEETRFVPDSLQWAKELDVFRQIDQVNKAAFRDAYVVSETRDTNSNLMVREITAQGDAPVASVRFFYLRNPSDIRKIEATLHEENALYMNVHRLTMEFEPANSIHLIQRYRIEGIQKMAMDDSLRFVIAGEIGI